MSCLTQRGGSRRIARVAFSSHPLRAEESLCLRFMFPRTRRKRRTDEMFQQS